MAATLTMKRTCLLLLLALAPLVAKALDLTPEPTFRDLEGVKIPILLFSDGGKKITLQPPAKWRVSGGGASLSLLPPDAQDAVMLLRILPRKPPAPEVTEDLDKWCRAQLPKDAAEPKLESEIENGFTLGPLGSREFTYSYAALGRRFTTSVAVVDWNERERLAVIVTARAADFAATHETAMRSIFTWAQD